MTRMLIVTLCVALGGCAETFQAQEASMTMDSEDCRTVAWGSLATVNGTVATTSTATIEAFDRDYRACMADKGYELPPPAK